MAVRTAMASLIPIVQRLVSDATAATWDTTERVQDALDAHATHFDYMPLWHDSDYHLYAARQRSDTARLLSEANVSQLVPVVYHVPDFGHYYRVGYLDNGWVIRASPDEASAATSPNLVDVIGASFVFSTAQNQELYLRATAYNVWKAAADLLMETPDTGREYDSRRVRGQVTRDIKQKWELYRQRGLKLNRLRPTYAAI